MTTALYRAYRRTLKATPFTGRFMPYGWSDLPNPLDGAWMAYSQMLGEFSFELADTINGFSHDVHRLQAWAAVVRPLSNKQKLEATHEFIDTLATAYGAGWAGYGPLKRCLERIGGQAFKDATGDFGNTYNHRFSPRFVIGMTGLVSRLVDKDTGQVSYGFGGREPLDLGEIADLLATDRDRCYAAFAAFQALVGEHEAAIRDAGTPGR